MRAIDTFPTNKIQDLEYCIGRVFPFGATITDGGVNFSVFSREAKSCTLVLYHHGQQEPFVEIPFPETFRIGNVYAMMVYGLDTETVEYGYRFGGEWAPERGLRFDERKVLLDPYAKSVSGRSVWRDGKDGDFIHRGQIIREDYAWEGDKPLEIPFSDLVIYEMHVRSFTADKSSGVKRRGTFAGLTEKIPYLRELGVNCVELMPVFEFDEFENVREHGGRTLVNYWGYSTVGFFAPKAGYAASAPFGLEADEMKNMVRLLHKNGIEVILDVVFNHTAEGDENGPAISFKGIDNRTYYLLTPDGHYYNFSGCGNTMNCNYATVRSMILDCLRYWVASYHIDGFRFDLASILTRDESGAPMMTPPLLEAIARDPVLGRCRLIAEAWDAGGLYQVGRFPSWNRWSEWNGRYRDCVRRFIKGDGSAAEELINRLCGSPDMYEGRGTAASVNFITCHDGFTLRDLVSYNEKHNEGNGEDNRDGCNDNLSWNCGAEGDTDDENILSLRRRQMKNMLTVLLMSRGVPMLLSGDEFGNTQYGNNNAYCQDNEISWLDWRLLKKNRDLFTYTKKLIALRRRHPVLRAAHFDTGYNGTGYPEMSFHGTEPWKERGEPLTLACLYAEDHIKYGTKRDTYIYFMINSHWEDHVFTLPIVPEGHTWKIEAASSEAAVLEDKAYIPARSVMVLATYV
ncbi:MAG: glycogen debranching protein GlgX [Oscillospiraceae bacterium]|nr:glycogen debranching protein GlgX [Oscillospiraceae bacterium]